MLHARMLNYLDTVARAGSIRGAAERLNIAASSINRQILALEEELGVQLFERMPRKLRLTVAGELLIGHARQTLRDYEAVQARLKEMQGLRRGLVRIATMGGLAGSLLPEVVAWMRARYPLVKLVISVLPLEGIVAAVGSGEAELGFAFQIPYDSKLRVIARTALQVGVVTSPGHKLVREGGIHISDCIGWPMILPDPSLTIGGLMARALERSNIGLESVVETNSIELLKATVAGGDAITFLNELDASTECRDGRLAFTPLLDDYVPRHELRLVQRQRGTLDTVQSLMAEELRKLVANVDRMRIR